MSEAPPPAGPSSPVGCHRVLDPPGVLPQAAERLDARAQLWPDEVRLDVERVNLDAASFRQLRAAAGGDPQALRDRVLQIVRTRGKMHNPVTGSGGMLIGRVAEVGPASPLGLRVAERVATLVSLTLTPLVITDGLARWDGRSEQVPAAGHAILFARSVAAPLPADLPDELALAALDVCGAPALVQRAVRERAVREVLVIGAGGKSGSLSLAAARAAGARHCVGLVPSEAEAARLRAANLADAVVVADAREPVAAAEVARAAARCPGGAQLTVVCADVAGCEGAALLATAAGGRVLFFSMATSFTAAALGAEGLGADLELVIGNGYVPGHAELAVQLLRTTPGLRALFEDHLAGQPSTPGGPVSPARPA